MARTINEIYNEMIAEKQSNAVLNDLQPNIDSGQKLLSDLTTSSKVAIWRLYFYVVAVCVWSHEKLFDEYSAEIEKRANELITGTLRWYTEQSKLFQYGDSLIWDQSTQKYKYPDGSTGEKIVSQASTIETSTQVRIKIAKNDGSGGLEPLSDTEETSFKTYINKIKFAGTNVQITNIESDKLRLKLNIFYNPLILTSTGESILNPGVFPVSDAIVQYIQFLPFDGKFNKTELIDAVQVVDGVIDPQLLISKARSGNKPLTNTGQNYTANAGYLEIDPGFPLDDPAVLVFKPVIK